MSEQAPEPRAGGGSVARRPVLGVPLYGWGIILGAGLGAIWLLRRARGGSGTSTSSGVSSSQVPSDQQIGLTEYEQISAQLTGIEGTDQALLAAIKDLQGADSAAPGTDRDRGRGGNDARQDEAEQDQDQAEAAADEEAGETPDRERRENRRRTVPPSNRRVITGGRSPATTPPPAQTPGPAARRRRRARRRAAA